MSTSSGVLSPVIGLDFKYAGIITQIKHFKNQIACPEKGNNKFAPYDALNQHGILFEKTNFAFRFEFVEFIDIHDTDVYVVLSYLPFY